MGISIKAPGAKVAQQSPTAATGNTKCPPMHDKKSHGGSRTGVRPELVKMLCRKLLNDNGQRKSQTLPKNYSSSQYFIETVEDRLTSWAKILLLSLSVIVFLSHNFINDQPLSFMLLGPKIVQKLRSSIQELLERV